MPTLAGWLTGEQVSQEIIEQTLTAMGDVLSRLGGTTAYSIQPGFGLITISDPAYAMQNMKEQPVLDWIPERRTLLYRRPLSGIHPLYYVTDWPAKGNLLFASEIKALFAVGVPRRLHIAALDALLNYGFIPAPWTAFKDIFVVPSGSILRWQHARTVVNHASDFSHVEEHTPETYEYVETRFRQICAGLLPPHQNIVALTGGGRFSALAAAMTVQQTGQSFTIATLGDTQAQNKNGWETVKHIARASGLSQLTITGIDQPEFWITTLRGLEAPCGDTRPLAIHQLLHTTQVKTGARVAISGLGSNTLLGQRNYHSAHLQSTHDTKDILRQYFSLPMNQSQGTSPLWSDDVKQALQSSESWEDTLHARKLARRANQFLHPQQASYYLDLHLRLPDMLVTPFQQIATQERLSIRTPYLTTPMMDMLIRNTMPTINVNPNATPIIQNINALVRTYIPGIANIFDGSTPLSLAIPITTPIHKANSDLVRQCLAPEAIRKTGIFHPQVVKAVLQQAEKDGVSTEFLLVFTTQLLYQLFNIEDWA